MISDTRIWRRALGTTTALLLVTGVAAAGVMAGDDRSGSAIVDGERLAVGSPVPMATLASVADATKDESYRAEGAVTLIAPLDSSSGEEDAAEGPTELRFVVEYDAATRLVHLRSVEPSAMKVDVISGEDVVYFRTDMGTPFGNPDGRWVRTELPQDLGGATMRFGVFDANAVLQELVASGAGTVTFEGTERLRGVTVLHYLAKPSVDDFAAAIDVWVDEDGRLRRLRASDIGGDGAGPETTVDVSVFDIGDDGIHVDAPADAVDAPSD